MGMVAQYLEQIFANLPQNERNDAYRENLKKQMKVVFNAECASGKTPDEALAVAVAAAPNYEEICAALEVFETAKVLDSVEYEKRARWNSFWFATAIALFVASPVGMIYLSIWKHSYNLVGSIAMLLSFLGVGVGVLAYALREKRALLEFRPKTALNPVRVWSLLLGVFLVIYAGASLYVSFAWMEGKLFSLLCASSLVECALAVLAFLYYGQMKRCFKKF